MKVSVTKMFEFEAAHFLSEYKGACKNMHGHSYKLEIEVIDDIGEDGFVVDFKELKDIVNKKIVNHLDHKLLNEVFDFYPTAENMVIWIVKTLDWKTLTRVRLYETSTSYAEWRRDVC